MHRAIEFAAIKATKNIYFIHGKGTGGLQLPICSFHTHAAGGQNANFTFTAEPCFDVKN